MKLEFSRQIFERYLDIKFHENMFRENRVVPRGRMEHLGSHNNVTKLIVAFRNFATTPKNYKSHLLVTLSMLQYHDYRLRGVWAEYEHMPRFV